MSFLTQLKKTINSGQARAVVLTGNIYDLFSDGEKYVPLIDFLAAKTKLDPVAGKSKGITQVVYQVNRPIEVLSSTPGSGNANMEDLDKIWGRFHTDTKALSVRLTESTENSVYALELMRQMTECNRKAKTGQNNLLMIVEGADMLLPESEISRMMAPDRKRVAIVHDWFSDPDFVNGHDSVILLAESRSLLHHRIARLPQVVSIEVPLPDRNDRYHFILNDPASAAYKKEHHCELADALADQTAGLSLHAIRQLLRSGQYDASTIATKVEEYMISQLGDGVVEFKRPTHTLEKCVGNKRIKQFMEEELIPGFKASGDACIAGAAVGGPIGGGKTFICEAVASELDCPVIVLKNIRSKWFGETDQIFERLKRLLETFHKIVIFVDEADTMFGDIQSDHDTERRLTGKIQAMMSDPLLRGRVIWFLMTARIHRLSPDIRRPGRMDLIIPILDPEGEDHAEFVKWTFGKLVEEDKEAQLAGVCKGFSAASFGMLRSRLKVKPCDNIQDALRVAEDLVMPDIEETREYQALQAQLNCTRKSLLVDPKTPQAEFNELRKKWKLRIGELERIGIK